MGFEAVFFTGYPLLLVGAALGLHRLGRADTSPWRSRALAGHRRQVPDPLPTDEADWPHSEAGRVHTLVALVTALSALTLVIVGLTRNHRPTEFVVLSAVALLAVATTASLARAFTNGHQARP